MYGSAPQPPDPQETAAAQTQTNLSTAIGNTYLGNMNQVTPDGTLTYKQTGQNFVNDPNGQTYYYNKDANGGDGKYVLGDSHKGEDGWNAVSGYEVPTFTVTTSLSPDQAEIHQNETDASKNLSALAKDQSARIDNILGKSINLNNAPKAWDPSNLDLQNYTHYKDGPDLQTKLGNAGNVQDNYKVDFNTNDYANALMARLNPQLRQDSDALSAKLVNQGLQPGSEAYNRAFQQQGQKENDARVAAILNAGQEQSRVAGLAQQQAEFHNAAQAQQYSQNLQDANFTNAAKQQMYGNQNAAISGNNALQDQSFNARLTRGNAIDQARANYLNEQYANRNQNINEITSLMSGAPVQSPNFVNTNPGQIANVDYAGIVNDTYKNKLAAYQQDQTGLGQLFGSIGNLFSMSDRRVKKDIKKVGELKGMGLYEYAMRGNLDDGKRHLGVIAQEVEKKRPDVVITGHDGIKRVNYGKLFAAGA